ncbi:hypothetical protein HR09_08915 [Porphyromonas gulae]|nr:hypothetical protein HR09_08915 [Porphyromonas gulae]
MSSLLLSFVNRSLFFDDTKVEAAIRLKCRLCDTEPLLKKSCGKVFGAYLVVIGHKKEASMAPLFVGGEEPGRVGSLCLICGEKLATIVPR